MSNPLFAFRRDDDFSFGGAARGLPPGVHLEFYGGGKGGSSTQTVSIPPEVLARYNAVNARAENVAQTPFTPYSTDPNAFVADLTSSQKAGISNINAQQGAANQAVNAGQDLQMQGIGTAQAGQGQANAINQAALQGISQAQQQGTAYNQAAGRNIGNAMNSAAPYMQQNAALQNQGLAQQQGYQRAATQNIGNAMNSAAPYMQQMAGFTQAGLGQGQQYLGGATDLTQQAIQTGQQYAGKAEPYYTGALQASQPLNQQAQQYMQAGTQAVNPNALDYGQYMNPYMKDVVQAQQALQAQENAQQRSALQGKAIQAGAFGGDRAGIEQANLARQQSLANQATMANLLQSGYGQAQAAAQQQQGVGLGAAQANRAAQQQAAQQAAALGNQQYNQTMGVGTGLSALGQQQYGQALGTGSQLGTLGQQGYTQNLGAGAQLGQVGQNLYNQNIGQGQAMANLGQQGLAAMQGTGTNLGNIGQQLFGQNIAQGQAIQGLGNQQFTQGLQGSQAASGIGQSIFGNAAQTAGIQQAGGMNTANLGLQNQAAQIAAAQAQMAAGQQQQQTQQAGKTALYNQFLQQQGYPFQIAQFLANIAEGTGALSGSTTSAARTGQRGGRMGDGYASGGLVPDSQGGAVYEPGLYGRGGYAAGGAPAYVNRPDPEGGYENWYDASGNQVSSSDPALLSWLNNGKAPATSAKPAAAAGKEGDPGSWENFIKESYQKDFGRDPDPEGLTYWESQLASGAVDKGSFADMIGKGAQGSDADTYKQRNTINADTTALTNANPDVAALYKDVLGRDPDPAGAKYYNDMLKAGMSLDQIKYNMQHSTEAGLKSGDVNALKGTPLTYDASKFSQPVAPVRNQYGAFSAGDFTPGVPGVDPRIENLYQNQFGRSADFAGGKYWQNQLNSGMGMDQMSQAFQGAQEPQPNSWMNSYNNMRSGYGQPQGGYGSYSGGYGQPQNYGNMSAMQGGYGGYGGGLGGYGGGMMGGYGQPSNYGMPNFGSSPQYGGAPDYSGAMQYGGMQQNYGMPQGYGMPQQSYGMPPQYQQPTQYQQYQPPMQSTPAIPQSVLDRYAETNNQAQQQQVSPTATGKGAAPATGTDGLAGSTTTAQTTAAPTATGKGVSSPSTATGKGASGMAGGGRAGFADGGRAGYAAGGGDPSSVLRGLISQYDPGDPQGLVARQAAMFAGAPGAGAAGYVPPSQGGAGQNRMLQPQASILPQQQSGVKEAIGMGTSIASLGEAGSKLYSKMTSKPGTDTAADTFKEGLGNFADKTKSFFGFGEAAGGRIGYALQGGIPYSQGTDPNKDPSRVGYMGMLDLQQPIDPTQAFNAQKAGQMPSVHQASNPLVQGAQAVNALNSGAKTLKGAADFLGIGKTAPDMGSLANAPLPMARPEGLGAASPEMGSLSSAPLPMARPEGLGALVSESAPAAAAPALETGAVEAAASPVLGEMIGAGAVPAATEAASLTALGEGAATMGAEMFAGLAAGAGSALELLPFAFLKTGGRVGKAGGGSLVDPSNPQDQAMAKSFDNLLQRYDNNPLLAAAAMDVGTKVVDAAIQKAKQTGGDITDFLPRRTQEYMFALSKAALGAHEAISRPARAAGGRTGYALPGFVNDEPTGLAPAPSDAMSMGDFAGGLAPQGAGVQVAGPAPAADKSLDYDAMIGRASKETGIPVDLLRAQITQESKFNPNAVGKAGEIGLTQVLPSTAKKPGFGMAGVDPETLRDPEQNILFGAKYLAARGQAAGVKDWNNPEEAAKGLRAYNGGGDPNYVANVYRHMGLTSPANVGEQKPVQTAGLAPSKTDAGSLGSIGKTISDSVPTDSSFWVPLIAGLGTMLASDKYRFSQRLGEGLVGGTAAYGKQQEFQQKNEQQAQQIAQNAALMGLKNKEFGLKEQEFSLTQRTQAIQIMQQLQKINLGRQMAGQPELSADDYFKQVGASDLLPAVKAPAATSTAAPAVTPPAPAGGLKPPASAAPTTGGAEAGAPASGLKPPAVTPAAGPSATPQSIAAAAPGMPSARDPFWATVDRPYSLPVMEQNWNLAMSMGDTATANAIMQRMDRIEKSGEVMVGGKVTHIPGYLDAQAAAAAAKETATKQAGLPFIERIGPGGEKYIPALADQAKGTTPNIPPASTEAGKVEPAGSVPQKAVIDQKTGQVNGSIPAPPPGGGYPMSKQPGATGMTQAAQRLAKNDEQFEKDFMEKTPTMDTTIERIDQMANGFKMIHSGAMEDKLKGYAALAASYGDQKLAARILGGQVGAVAAAQLIDKNKVNYVLDTLKAANPRFAQSEFLKMSDVGSPDIAIDPTANHGMLSANKGIMEWSRQFTRDWEKAKEAGWQSPSAFFNEWSQLNPLSTFQESARRRMGTFGGMDLPPINEWTEGAVYHVPKGLKGPQAEQMGRAGLKGGDTFRFLGDKIERVKPSELFKYGQ